MPINDAKTVFISCGEYTDAEKTLGDQISEMVKLAGLDPFFAQQVHDLNGLDENILRALKSCFGFITVLHPRGNINPPDGLVITRASVWIEQEIAIATYIKRVEKRLLPIIAFKHRLVALEGIRQLIHLNPIEFTVESEILEKLPNLLNQWKPLKSSGIKLQIYSEATGLQEGHTIRSLNVKLVNETNSRIKDYFCRIYMPEALLKHWNETYMNSELHPDGIRWFSYDQGDRGPIDPHGSKLIATRPYCTQCALRTPTGLLEVASAKVTAKFWIGDQEYSIEKTIQELAIDAARRDAY